MRITDSDECLGVLGVDFTLAPWSWRISPLLSDRFGRVNFIQIFANFLWCQFQCPRLQVHPDGSDARFIQACRNTERLRAWREVRKVKVAGRQPALRVRDALGLYGSLQTRECHSAGEIQRYSCAPWQRQAAGDEPGIVSESRCN